MRRTLTLCSLLAAFALTACGKKEAPKPAQSTPPTASAPAAQQDGNWEPYNCGKDMICFVQVDTKNHSAVVKADISAMAQKENPALTEVVKTHKIEMKTTLKFDCAKKLGRLHSIGQNKVSRSNANEIEVMIPETPAKTEEWAKMSPDRDDWAIFNKACQE